MRGGGAGEQALRAAEAGPIEPIVFSVGAGFAVGVTVRCFRRRKGQEALRADRGFCHRASHWQ